MKATVVVSVCFALLVCTAPAHSSGFLPHKPHLSKRERVAYLERSVRKDKTAIAWLRSQEAPRTLQRVTELRWYTAALHWHRQLLANARSKLEPQLRIANLSAWLCIHGGEGSWTDPNAPYYGGLQMDIQFQSTYGPPVLLGKPSTKASVHELFDRFGTADHWTPLQQIAVAEYARASGRGFYPWPNTARACGLI